LRPQSFDNDTDRCRQQNNASQLARKSQRPLTDQRTTAQSNRAALPFEQALKTLCFQFAKALFTILLKNITD
jgi:hypothetical protein